MLDRIHRFNDRVSNLLLWLGGLGLVAMTIIVGWQVFARYVLNASPSWSEQLTLLLMIWYAMFAAAAGFQQGYHIKIAALQTAASPRWARALRLIVEAVVFLFGLLFIVWGVELALTVRTHVIPSIGLSRSWAYAPLPIAGFFTCLFAGTRLVGEILQPGFADDEAGDADAPDDASADLRARDDPRIPDAEPAADDLSPKEGR